MIKNQQKWMKNIMTSFKHKKLRILQKNNADSHHHPQEKILQLEKFEKHIYGEILEVFAGAGNLTKYYEKLGKVTALKKEVTGDSFEFIYKLLSSIFSILTSLSCG